MTGPVGRDSRADPRTIGTAVLTAVSTAVADRVLRDRGLPGGRARWARRNHRGEPVTLLEGVAFVAGTAVPLVVLDPVAAVVVLAAGTTGALDDLHPDAARKGLRGHLGALRRGEVSGGALKIVGLLATGLLGALPGAGGRPVTDTAVRAALLAGSANLANLLDLRPGRALKAAVLTGIPLTLSGPGRGGLSGPGRGGLSGPGRGGLSGPGMAGRLPAAATVAAAAVLLPGDLRGTSMLGDTGANPVGALLGLSVTRTGDPRTRLVALAVVTALTLASERVSFTAVIAATPVLRDLDAWGRAS